MKRSLHYVAKTLSTRLWALLFALLAICTPAWGNNPRWVSGQPYFTWGGTPVVWYTRTPLYFTDPGDLSQYVSHAQADAIVAAAANVWNVPTADFTIAQGGNLAEHVSSADTTLGQNSLIFPADVESTNYTNIQIAIVYDSDGSVTDLLLGQGASGPLECSQNGVTESVDSFNPSGFIQHAVLVVNGRCTSSDPRAQLQLQYQLERAFGRVFGVGWSQTNDNVFTGNPVPTLLQAQHWPIMHPIDINCGPYSYQCLPNPFTLRDDDVAAISGLYLIGYSEMFSGWRGYDDFLPGKTQSYDHAGEVSGWIYFTGGQLMEGVNVEMQREEMFSPEPQAYYDVSNVSGFMYQQFAGNPVTGVPAGMAGSLGGAASWQQSYFDLGWVPMLDSQETGLNIIMTTEAVNPLYTGTHSVGPYPTGTVAPSGVPTQSFKAGIYANDAGFFAVNGSFVVNGSAVSCPSQQVGSETAPEPVATTGFWTGTFCNRAQSSWMSFTARAGRTATVEVTALDETGAPTETKSQPLIGLWNASDPTGTAPTVALTLSPFNSMAVGTSSLIVSGTGSGLRMAIAEARGDGRPDYPYSARVLYLDNVQPATTSLSGGAVTLSGMGFRSGNQVLINGVAAQVASWTANTIVAIAPPLSTYATQPTGPMDITVHDSQTGSSTTLSSALSYGAVPSDAVALVSAPSGQVAVGVAAATPFAVRVLLPGGAPAAGIPVIFSANGGGVQFTGCTGSPCTSQTDSTGLASVSVAPQSYGTVELQAAAVGSSVAAGFSAVARSIAPAAAVQYLAAGVPVQLIPAVNLTEDAAAAANVPVTWTASSTVTVAAGSSTSNASGQAAEPVSVAAMSAGQQASVQACAWAGTPTGQLCTNVSAVAVDPSQWRLRVVSGAGQAIAVGGTFAPVVMLVTDPAGHAIVGAPVTLHEAADATQQACPSRGACPVPALLTATTTSLVTAQDGTVSVQPQQIAGIPEVTNVSLSAGTQGFVSLALTQGP